MALKAKLWLQVNQWFEVEYEPEDTYALELNLVLDSGVIFNLRRDENIANDNIEKFKRQLTYNINTASLLLNSIPGLELKIDQSIVEYIEGEEDAVGKFLNQLVKEL